MLVVFPFFFYSKDLYATLSLCLEVKINMTVIYQIQNKINIQLYCCYSDTYHSVHVCVFQRSTECVKTCTATQ